MSLFNIHLSWKHTRVSKCLLLKSLPSTWSVKRLLLTDNWTNRQFLCLVNATRRLPARPRRSLRGEAAGTTDVVAQAGNQRRARPMAIKGVRGGGVARVSPQRSTPDNAAPVYLRSAPDHARHRPVLACLAGSHKGLFLGELGVPGGWQVQYPYPQG
jgi:hypothetical protein